DSVHAMPFAWRQTRDVERRWNRLDERRAGESNVHAVELRAGDRPCSGATARETVAQLDAEALGGVKVEECRAGAGVENEIQWTLAGAHFHVDVIAVDVDRNGRRLGGGGRRWRGARGGI